VKSLADVADRSWSIRPSAVGPGAKGMRGAVTSENRSADPEGAGNVSGVIALARIRGRGAGGPLASAGTRANRILHDRTRRAMIRALDRVAPIPIASWAWVMALDKGRDDGDGQQQAGKRARCVSGDGMLSPPARKAGHEPDQHSETIAPPDRHNPRPQAQPGAVDDPMNSSRDVRIGGPDGTSGWVAVAAQGVDARWR